MHGTSLKTRAPARRARPGHAAARHVAARHVAAGLLAALAAIGAPAAKAQSEAEIGRALDRIVGGGRYQTSMPDPEEATPPAPPAEPFRLSLGEIGEFALYALLVVAALFILRTLFKNRVAAPSRGAVPREVAATQRSAPRPPSAAELADAERKALSEAAAGHFEEAIHLLLLGAIGDLRARDARAAARALTSREILARARLGPETGAARSALRALVAAVEVSRFGGRPADEAAFERCLDAYRALRRAIAEQRDGVKGGGEQDGGDGAIQDAAIGGSGAKTAGSS